MSQYTDASPGIINNILVSQHTIASPGITNNILISQYTEVTIH